MHSRTVGGRAQHAARGDARPACRAVVATAWSQRLQIPDATVVRHHSRWGDHLDRHVDQPGRLRCARTGRSRAVGRVRDHGGRSAGRDRGCHRAVDDRRTAVARPGRRVVRSQPAGARVPDGGADRSRRSAGRSNDLRVGPAGVGRGLLGDDRTTWPRRAQGVGAGRIVGHRVGGRRCVLFRRRCRPCARSPRDRRVDQPRTGPPARGRRCRNEGVRSGRVPGIATGRGVAEIG